MNLALYTTEWSKLYQHERAKLASLLGSDALDIQHIGSTAIPGIASKPIVDIMVMLSSLQQAKKYTNSLHELGYVYSEQRSSTERCFFTKGDPAVVHLSLTDHSTPYWDRQLVFRDYLLSHPDAAKEYETLKQSLMAKFPSGRDEYSYGKSEFVASTLKRAGFPVQ